MLPYLLRAALFLFLLTQCVYGDQAYHDIPDLCQLRILTPSLANIQTAKIKLNNGIQAYLISDPSCSQSAASLSLKTGSLSDPDHALGIAHFVEHLLFMGSSAYPEENGYKSLISNHNGLANAYTVPNRTVYTFSISHIAFREALDRFASNFISPLFSSSGIKREIYAIEQEKTHLLEDFEWRLIMVLKAIGNPHHPFCRFSIGDRTTLAKVDQKSLFDWYDANYSSDLASLVLYSPLPIDTLKELTATCFSPMPKREVESPQVLQPISSLKQQGSLIAIEPLDKTTCTLKMMWELPQSYTLNLLDHSAYTLIACLLNSPHPGSLLEQLQEEGLIKSMVAWLQIPTDHHAFFSVNFDLTPAGLISFEEVIKRFYQYLHFIRDEPTPPFFFDEVQTMLQLEYAYQERALPFAYVEECADLIAQTTLDLFPQQFFSLPPFDSKEKELFLSALKPKLATYLLIAPSVLTGLAPTHKEKWFGIEYTLKPIKKETLRQWSLATSSNFLSLTPSPFIPTNLTLSPTSPSYSQNFPKPTCIADDPYGIAYLWQDDRFFTPKIDWLFRLRSKVLDHSAKSYVLKDLFSLAFHEQLHPLLHQASRGALSITCQLGAFDISFRLAGYNEKALTLLDRALLTGVNPNNFDKHSLLLKAFYLEKSCNQATSPLEEAQMIAESTLYRHPSYLDKLKALEKLTQNDFADFLRTLSKENYIEGIFAGNLSKEEALRAWQRIKQTLFSTPYPKEEHRHSDCSLFSPIDHAQVISKTTEATGHAALLILEHPLTSPLDLAAATILSQAIGRDFFNVLRTQKQLAYALYTQMSVEKGYSLLSFNIQSTSYPSSELLSQIEQFLDNFLDHFETLFPKERFETIRSSLIADSSNPLTDLNEITTFLDSLTFTPNSNVEHVHKYLLALKTLTYDHLKNYAEASLSHDNQHRLAICVQGKPPPVSSHPPS